MLTAPDQRPHKSTGEFRVSIEGGTAVLGEDVVAFEPLVFSLDAEDFEELTAVQLQGRWRARGSTGLTLTVIDDPHEEEEDETYTLTLEALGASDSDNPGDPNITFVNPGDLTIPPSDVSDASEIDTLSALSLSAGTLAPVFDAATTEYTAAVPFSDSQLTVTATATDEPLASVSWRLGDSGTFAEVPATGSFQVNLAEGPNIVQVQVTAEDPREKTIYQVTVTREPQVGIAVATSGTVTEGGDVEFRVTRSRANDAALTVNLTVADTGDVLEGSQEGAQSVVIAAGQTSAVYTVTTRDNLSYAASTGVTVTVVAGTGYTPSATANSAMKDVRDDDFPGAAVSLEIDREDVAEGESVRATVRITTDTADTPHAGVPAGLLFLRASDTATSTPGDDYAFTERRLQFNRNDFTRTDIDPAPEVEDFRWVATKTETIRITDDRDTEGEESLVLLVARPDAQEEPAALHPNVRLPSMATATVLIAPSDSDDATLSALDVTVDGERAGHRTPDFRPEVSVYTAGVGNTVTQVTLEATTTHEDARIQFRRGSTPLGSATTGTATQVVNLSVGTNALSAVVTAENGATSTYQLTITRAPQDTALTPPASARRTSYETTVTYDVTFTGRWTDAVTPDGVPSGATFTTLIGGVHGEDVTFLASGDAAGAAVESMAETGSAAELRSEVQAAIDADTPTASSIVEQVLGGGPTPVATLDIELTSSFPWLTLLSRVDPTPDWFVGVSGLELLNDQGLWVRAHAVDLFPWDAGTEEGEGFDADGQDTDPAEAVGSRQGVGVFTNARIATLEFTLRSVSTTREIDENADAGTNVGAAVRSPVAPPTGGGAVTYALAGADAASFTINSSTGQIQTKAGVTYDYEAKNRYDLVVVATDAGPDPDLVTNIDVTITLANVDEPGILTVQPPTPSVDATMTANVADPDGSVTGLAWLWQRLEGTPASWTDIPGATGRQYTAVAADEGLELRVNATYADGHGPDKSLTAELGEVGESMQLSDDSTLSALALSGVDITFASDTYSYSASVGYGTARTTIAAMPTFAEATILLLDGTGEDAHEIPDADMEAKGVQAALAIGSDNTIVVRVTAENGSSSNYVITITRARPTVTLSAPSGTLVEGGVVPFLLTRSEAADDVLAVKVTVSESGAIVGGDPDEVHSVEIPAGEASVPLEFPSTGDDAWEEHSEVTATIQPDDSYTIGTDNQAVQTVRDDDFPTAVAVLTVTSPVVEEDDGSGSATATVTVTTVEQQQPHKDGGSIRLRTAPGTASTSDFTAKDETLVFLEADFQLTEIDPDPDDLNNPTVMRYRAVEEVVIPIMNDSLAEGDETFTVSIEPVTTGASPFDEQISLEQGGRSLEVTISANDRSTVASLSNLALSAGTLDFDPATTDYAVDVAFADERITVTPTLADNTATLAFLHEVNGVDVTLPDASETLTGHQVDLAVGATTFQVRVTAQDETTQETYTVTVTRPDPVLTLTVSGGDPVEGDTVEFTVSRNGATAETTAFTLAVSETGGPLADPAHLGTLTLEIGPGEDSHTHTVATSADEVWQPHAVITAAATATVTFDGPATITKQVLDDDFPEATATLAVAPSPADEEPGGHVTATLTIATARDEEPHSGTGTILLSTQDGTAVAPADYTALTASTGALGIDDPTLFKRGADDVYRATISVDIAIVDDVVPEGDEQFTVSMAPVTTGSSPTDAAITVATDPVPVVISANDRSSDNTLSALTLTSGGTAIAGLAWNPAFTPGVTEYAVTVPFEHQQVTIEATPNDDAATVGIPDDDDPNVPGAQVDLGVGVAEAVKVEVTAEDGSANEYELTITRALPVLRISVNPEALGEGDLVVATISRTGSVPEPTAFSVTVSEQNADGNMVEDALETTAQHLIQGGDDSFTLEIPTVDDGDWDATSTVTVVLEANATAYTISGPATVTKEVTDDDFPQATASLSLSTDKVDEGNPVTATITITTAARQQPNKDAGGLRLATEDGPDPDGAGLGQPATAGADYIAVDRVETFARSEFSEVDIGGGVMRWQLEKTVEISILADQTPEFTERFTVALSTVTADPNITDPHITLAQDASLTVDINAHGLGDMAGLKGIELRSPSRRRPSTKASGSTSCPRTRRFRSKTRIRWPRGSSSRCRIPARLSWSASRSRPWTRPTRWSTSSRSHGRCGSPASGPRTPTATTSPRAPMPCSRSSWTLPPGRRG